MQQKHDGTESGSGPLRVLRASMAGTTKEQ